MPTLGFAPEDVVTLESIAKDPLDSLTLMERFVNNGSPSGFSFTHTTSARTCPRSEVRQFHLFVLDALPTVEVHELGIFPDGLIQGANPARKMLVHPDMFNNDVLRSAADCQLAQETSFFVDPAASGRTVRLQCAEPNGYVKLHYEGYLGRVTRQITLQHAQAALETNSLMSELVSACRLPEPFAFLREPAARVFQWQDSAKLDSFWGMIWRPAKPLGRSSDNIAYLIPAFSLFGQDNRRPESTSLISQLGEVHCANKVGFLLDELLLPLIRSYFALLAEGLQGEWHAENILFGFDHNWRCVSIVARDLESVDRDIPLMVSAGHSTELASAPYKCVVENPSYAIRHSFMFDHKLGEYLLGPVVDHCSRVWEVDKSRIDEQLIDAVMEELRAFPANFFPADGCWYKFSDGLIDRSGSHRPYVAFQKPRFRRL